MWGNYGSVKGDLDEMITLEAGHVPRNEFKNKNTLAKTGAS